MQLTTAHLIDWIRVIKTNTVVFNDDGIRQKLRQNRTDKFKRHTTIDDSVEYGAPHRTVHTITALLNDSKELYFAFINVLLISGALSTP